MQAQLRDPDWKHDVWVRLTTVRQSTIIMGHRINDDHEASCPMLHRTMKKEQFSFNTLHSRVSTTNRKWLRLEAMYVHD